MPVMMEVYLPPHIVYIFSLTSKNGIDGLLLFSPKT